MERDGTLPLGTLPLGTLTLGTLTLGTLTLGTLTLGTLPLGTLFVRQELRKVKPAKQRQEFTLKIEVRLRGKNMTTDEIIEKILKKRFDIKKNIDSQAFLVEKDLMLKTIKEATKESSDYIADREKLIENLGKCIVYYKQQLAEKDKEFLKKIDKLVLGFNSHLDEKMAFEGIPIQYKYFLCQIVEQFKQALSNGVNNQQTKPFEEPQLLIPVGQETSFTDDERTKTADKTLEQNSSVAEPRVGSAILPSAPKLKLNKRGGKTEEKKYLINSLFNSKDFL